MNAGGGDQWVTGLTTLRARRSIQGVVALIVAFVPFVVGIPAAFAGVGLGVNSTFPSNATVGQSNLPATLQMTNTSTPPDSAGVVTITAIRLVPACGTNAFVVSGNCPAAQADPGVFQLTPTGVGEQATACAGQSFSITVVDTSTGQVTFTPSGGPVILSQPGTQNSVCRIDFFFSVLKAPIHQAGTSPPNAVVTDQLGFASASGSSGSTGTAFGSSAVVVAKSAPALTTQASTSTATVGASFSDTATLTAARPPGPRPTGTITFSLFAPSSGFCSGAPVFTSTMAVTSGPGSYTSALFTPVSTGTYQWVAVYSGDANNASVAGACAEFGESVNVVAARPSLATTASASGATMSDTAVLSGAFRPTGTISFSVFGPNNTACSGAPAFTSSSAVTGNGSYPSTSFTATQAGTYRYVASYSGDVNNNTVTGGCGAPGESVTVSFAPARFTYPTDGQTNVDTTQPFTWTPSPSASGYWLRVGTTPYGSDLVNSGLLPPSQTSYSVPPLPSGQTLYATLFTAVNGVYTTYHAITFTAAPVARTTSRSVLVHHR